MSLPDDPAAFVAEAERAINERDYREFANVYADAAVVERVNDGNEEVHRGRAEIRGFWERFVVSAAEFEQRKTLVSVSGDTIVSEWEDTVDGPSQSKGVEYWRFDADGKVYEHRIYGHMNVKSLDSPLQRLRLAWTYPVTAVAFLREQRRRKRR